MKNKNHTPAPAPVPSNLGSRVKRPDSSPRKAPPAVTYGAPKLESPAAKKTKEARPINEPEKPARGVPAGRTLEQIRAGLILDPNDWRTPLHGKEGEIHQFSLPETRAEMTLDSKAIKLEGAKLHCLFAIPRDSDIGGEGAEARALGMIAIHTWRSEDGSRYLGQPYYLHRSEVEELAPGVLPRKRLLKVADSSRKGR